MDNSVDRKNAIRLYLTGTIGQITVIAVIVYLLRRMGIVVDYTTVIGIIAIGIGGISSAMWGSIVTVRYRKINFKRIVIEFVNIKQPVLGYLLVFMFLSIALNKAGIDGPYVLCPHSMSGIEALYWAQEYPDEIEAIIGLDMAVPEYYENMKINLPLMKLGQYAANLGITRLIPTLAESDAIKHGTLTNDEKNRYRAIFYNRTATVTMINEAKSVKDNARIVAQNGVPQVPMLLFISDGTGGTGFDKETWRRIQEKYISEVESGKYIELDCPHYVHDYEYGRISEEIKSFLRIRLMTVL